MELWTHIMTKRKSTTDPRAVVPRAYYSEPSSVHLSYPPKANLQNVSGTFGDTTQ